MLNASRISFLGGLDVVQNAELSRNNVSIESNEKAIATINATLASQSGQESADGHGLRLSTMTILGLNLLNLPLVRILLFDILRIY